jgi:hypothetical protein
MKNDATVRKAQKVNDLLPSQAPRRAALAKPAFERRIDI